MDPLRPPWEIRRFLKKEKERKKRLKPLTANEKKRIEIARDLERMLRRPLIYWKTEFEGKAKMESEEEEKEGEDYAEEEEEEEEEEEKDHTCGICFSGSGRSIRGRINCCDHYFCFVCIMEWAKIETSCPLCKRRFESICRPPVRGLFRVKRVVNVPVRDQGNHRRAPDPYEFIPYRFCSDYDPRRGLLVCGLCDVGIHRNCVASGDSIPQANWYCPDCTICKDWHSRYDDSCPQNQPLETSRQNGSSSQTLNSDDPESIRKAWQMMELALAEQSNQR